MNSGQVSAPSPRRLGGAKRSAVQRWCRFLAGLLVILLFAFGVIPGLQRLEPVREVCDAIRKAGIDASALFYTESDVSSEAEASIRDAIRYSSHRVDGSADP
jgi:hypothetical protein